MTLISSKSPRTVPTCEMSDEQIGDSVSCCGGFDSDHYLDGAWPAAIRKTNGHSLFKKCLLTVHRGRWPDVRQRFQDPGSQAGVYLSAAKDGVRSAVACRSRTEGHLPMQPEKLLIAMDWRTKPVTAVGLDAKK